jgi:hypothetical protein
LSKALLRSIEPRLGDQLVMNGDDEIAGAVV